jgi:hypothetical protein
MRLVVAVAMAGLVALVVAVVTGSTFVAVLVIVLAVVGILLLLRDWRAERRQLSDAAVTDTPPAPGEEWHADADAAPMSADMFAPDISADGGGPSSDARAD